jgi:hypothetical protein
MGAATRQPPPAPLAGEGWGAGSAALDPALDGALLAAHARADERALARLYGQAADAAETAGEIDAACFFLTQAYVFALSAGAPQADALHARLRAHGREE